MNVTQPQRRTRAQFNLSQQSEDEALLFQEPPQRFNKVIQIDSISDLSNKANQNNEEQLINKKKTPSTSTTPIKQSHTYGTRSNQHNGDIVKSKFSDKQMYQIILLKKYNKKISLYRFYFQVPLQKRARSTSTSSTTTNSNTIHHVDAQKKQFKNQNKEKVENMKQKTELFQQIQSVQDSKRKEKKNGKITKIKQQKVVINEEEDEQNSCEEIDEEEEQQVKQQKRGRNKVKATTSTTIRSLLNANKKEQKRKANATKGKQPLNENKYNRDQQIEQIRLKYLQAYENLQEYSLPDVIPCRESEKQQIEDFLLEGLQSKGASQSLYISGVPGIGKTASFLEVIKYLEQERDDFVCIKLNGMELSNPESAYNAILREVTGITASTNAAACNILSDVFRLGKLPKKYQKSYSIAKKTKIILLDELDHLITQNQNLLYNLFDWPHEKNAKIIMVGIANTMDFPERLLHKIASRIGNRRVVYKPYTGVQIQQIIEMRLWDMEIFEPVAVNFASKKIATFSSDIRRTLHVCRKAIEIAEQRFLEAQKKPSTINQCFVDNNHTTNDIILLKVNIQDIQQSYNMIYCQIQQQVLPQLSQVGRLLLIALGLELRMRGQQNAYFSDMYQRARNMSSNLGQNVTAQFITPNEAYQIMCQFQCMKIVTLKEKYWMRQSNLQQNTLQKELNPDRQMFYNIMDWTIEFHLNMDDLTNGLKDDITFQKFANLF